MMANVLHPHIDFHPRPVSHAPSPFGFGFGLGPALSSSMSSTSWGSATPGHTNPAAFHQLASSVTQSASSSRPQKRRLDQEDDSENTRYSAPRDESMDRSPTPERPKRTAPKRARVVNPLNATSKDDSTLKENKLPSDDDVDIGVLLATLPPQSLLPILSGLLKAQPSLKSVILPLIPRPTYQDAIDSLEKANKKLQEKYPYSSGSAFSPHPSLFGMHPQQPPMRDDYVLSRIRPHVVEFVSTCISYFPYFSYKPPSSRSPMRNSTAEQSSSASTIQSLHNDRFHPAETFSFLQGVTKLIIAHPPLMIAELEPLILPRLSQEWKAWLENLDRLVNRDGILLSVHVVRSWEVEIEKLADSRAPGISHLMRSVRQHFPLKEGWESRARSTPPMQL